MAIRQFTECSVKSPRAGGIDAYYAGWPDRPRHEAAIDGTVHDSFPAIAPPSWSGGAGTPPRP
jgi:hypothetical protein